MIKQFNEYFGYVKEQDISVIYPDDFASADTLEKKLEYLKSLEDEESSRQTIIETKTSQLIGQTGIIFSLLSLFIANYMSKFSSWPGVLQFSLIVFFLIALFFYLSTIFLATKYLNISKYAYVQRSVSTVKKKFKDEADFTLEEVKDLIYSIERNTLLNNQKGSNLIYAYRSFRVGTVMVGFLSISLVISGNFTTNDTITKMEIQQPIIIQGLDSSFDALKREVANKNVVPIIISDSMLSNNKTRNQSALIPDKRTKE